VQIGVVSNVSLSGATAPNPKCHISFCCLAIIAATFMVMVFDLNAVSSATEYTERQVHYCCQTSLVFKIIARLLVRS
jgi:hypothetical protein